MRVTTRSSEDTMALGQRLGALLAAGQVVALCGPLGSGKTTFVKGLAAGLGVADAQQAVKSPTFVLIKEYQGRLHVAHADLYRLETIDEAARLDLQDYYTGERVCLIEWADKFPAVLPADHLAVTFEHCAPTERRLTFTPHGASWARVIAALRARP